MKLLSIPLILFAVLATVSCYEAPYPRTYEEKVESGRRLREIQDQDFRDRDRERRSAGRSGGYYYEDPGRSGPQPVW